MRKKCGRDSRGKADKKRVMRSARRGSATERATKGVGATAAGRNDFRHTAKGMLTADCYPAAGLEEEEEGIAHVEAGKKLGRE